MSNDEYIVCVKDSKSAEPTEYFCRNCEQLRLSLTDQKDKCANCGSTDIVTGKPGELDKEKLIMESYP